MSKIPEMVFGTIMKDKTFNDFIDSPDDPASPDFKKCVELYKRLVVDTQTNLEYLAKLEEIITQIRCQELAFKEIKLSEVRGYIYARAPFFQFGSNKKDIRVTVGKTVDYGEDLSVLLEDDQFVRNAKKKLVGKMSLEITANLMYIEEFEENSKVIV